MPTPLEVLRHHVSGAVARGEKEPITEIRERRQSTPAHRDRVHVAALLLLKLYADDYPKAIGRATDWTCGADPETFRFYADVATLLSRRYATLTGGRDA